MGVVFDSAVIRNQTLLLTKTVYPKMPLILVLNEAAQNCNIEICFNIDRKTY